MRMELHCMSHDVRHFVIASIVEPFHRMKDAPLDWLQSIVDVRHGTLQNHIRSIIQKPTLVHARKVMRDAICPAFRHFVF